MHSLFGVSDAARARASVTAPRSRPAFPTLQRVTLVLSIPGVSCRVTACRVSGDRYVVCFQPVGRRPRMVTIARAVLAAALRVSPVKRARIVGRV